MSDKKPYIKERGPSRNIDIYEADDMQYLFSDGAARFMFGTEVIKVELTRSLGAYPLAVDPTVENRETFLRLSMPVSSALEFCTVVLEHYGKNAKELNNAAQRNLDAIREALKRVNAVKI